MFGQARNAALKCMTVHIPGAGDANGEPLICRRRLRVCLDSLDASVRNMCTHAFRPAVRQQRAREP
jgi:hypothetical protein